MDCESMVFVKNHINYLWDLSNSFSNSSIDFYCCEGFHQVIYQEEWSIKLRVENGGWHESLNLLHVSRCEMLHFVTSYMKQNKSRKQTLESAQYGLEISFNPSHYFTLYWLKRRLTASAHDQHSATYQADQLNIPFPTAQDWDFADKR